MYTLTAFASLATLISTALSIGCGEFQSYMTYDSINANLSAAMYGSSFPPIPVSNSVQCNSTNTGGGNGLCNSTQCVVRSQPDVFASVPRQINLTNVDDAVVDQIFSLIKDDFPGAENVNTNSSWVYSTGGGFSQTCIEEGQTAYWGYTPGMNCVLGKLDACDNGSGIDNGTLIFACGVLTRSGTVNDKTPLLGYGYLDLERVPSGSTGPSLHNATVPSSNGAAGETDMVKSKVLSMSILVGFVAIALAL